MPLPESSSTLRALPSVDAVLKELADVGVPRTVLRNEIRAVLQQRREQLRSGSQPLPASVQDEVRLRLERLLQPSLRRVINATGVILHTNLGRAPLASWTPIAGYSNLEYDLTTGKRGKRDAHTAALLEAIVGRPSIVVNNNAAAVYLVLNELAAGHEVIVSRGELIEIGDGFRIPDIMLRSGVVLREVGTTNRTRLDDYANAINERTRLILRVHPSNFHIAGFTDRPSLAELSTLGIPVYEDLGSGCLVDLRAQGVHEPLVAESFEAGVNIISFSCDKLLGGPQSGIIAGDPALVARIRRNPMYRAFRADKLIIEALETTLRSVLRERWQDIPTLRMIFSSLGELKARAERISAHLGSLVAEVAEENAPIGGGSTPDQSLPTVVIRLKSTSAAALERRLRSATTPVIARVQKDFVLLDMRTISDSEENALIAAVLSAAAS